MIFNWNISGIFFSFSGHLLVRNNLRTLSSINYKKFKIDDADKSSRVKAILGASLIGAGFWILQGNLNR